MDVSIFDCNKNRFGEFQQLFGVCYPDRLFSKQLSKTCFNFPQLNKVSENNNQTSKSHPEFVQKQ